MLRHTVGRAHELARAAAVFCVVLVGIEVKAELFKALGAEQIRQLLLLLLAAELLEAFAHGRAHIAGPAACRADGLDSQIVRLQSLGLQDPVALLLEGEIFLLELLHGGHGVALATERRGQHMGGRPPQLPLNFAQTRLLFVDRRDAGAGGSLVLLFFALQPGLGPLHDGSGIRHGQSSFSFSMRSMAAICRSLSASLCCCTPRLYFPAGGFAGARSPASIWLRVVKPCSCQLRRIELQ